MQSNGLHGAEERLLNLILQSVRALLDERELRYAERWRADQQAIRKAEAASERHFADLNDWHRLVQERDGDYMRRTEYLSEHRGLIESMAAHQREDAVTHEAQTKRIEGLSARMDTMQGVISGGRLTIIAIGGIAVFLVAIITIGTFVFSNRGPQNVMYIPAPTEQHAK